MDNSTKLSIGGLILSTALALILFFAGQSETEPRYSVKGSEILAETIANEPNLRIMWGDENVPNVRASDIAIWNAGHEYLDARNISKTEPLRIILPEKARLLYAKVVSTSRDNLKFELSENLGNPTGGEILINVVGDEALEQNDGVLVRILYSSPDAGAFRVAGRIKGAKAGFILSPWNNIEPAKIPQGWVYAMLASMLLLLGMAISIIYSYGKRLRTNPSSVCYLCITNAIFMIIMLVYMFFKYVKPFFFGLPWVV
jgi:hypothetical protein